MPATYGVAEAKNNLPALLAEANRTGVGCLMG